MVLLPEQRLKALVDFYMMSLTEDYLFSLFGNQTFGKGDYDYFTNAKALLLRPEDSPRKVECNIFFNRDRQGLPTIHIALNQDIPGEGNGLGVDPGTQFEENGQDYRETSTRTYSARFNIICTSDNTFEVLIMYNVVRALFQGNPGLLAIAGLGNAKFSGQDLILTDYLMPATIYARGFIVDCLYEITAPSLKLEKGITQAFIESICGKPTEIINDAT